MQLSIGGMSTKQTSDEIDENNVKATRQDTDVDLLEIGSQLTTRSVVVVSKKQISCDLLGEAVILDLDCGVYYGLDEVGARVWRLFQTPRAIGDVIEHILEEYDVGLERCEHDLLCLLRELVKRGLIELHNESIG